MDYQDEKDIVKKIASGDLKAFESLFHKYYGRLCAFAGQMIHDDAEAEEIVQDLFVRLWEKRGQLDIETSVKNYLFRSVKNHCLNYIQHNKIKIRHAKTIISDSEESNSEEINFSEPDLLSKIEESIGALPEKRREIFTLSRHDGLKYHEIAAKLNISIKTVETQMSLAMKTLRDKLKHYNSFFSIFL